MPWLVWNESQRADTFVILIGVPALLCEPKPKYLLEGWSYSVKHVCVCVCGSSWGELDYQTNGN